MYSSRERSMTRGSACAASPPKNLSAASHWVASSLPAIMTAPAGPSWISNMYLLRCLPVRVLVHSRCGFSNAFGHAQLIASPEALIADGVHHLTHEVHPQSAGASLLEACRDIRRRQRKRIERWAVILDHQSQAAIAQGERDLDARHRTCGRAVHHHIHENLFEREFERHRFGWRQVGGRPELPQKPRQYRKLRRLARHARVSLHADRCGVCARAAVRSAYTAMTR